MSIANEPLFERLLALSPFSARELGTLVATAPYRYKDHYIEKRNGRGKRLISQPTAELKFLQRLIVRHEFSSLPIHEAATAYRPHRSIKAHALPHASARYLLKLDFRDYFPSLKASALRYRLSRDATYTEQELWILCQLLCRKPKRDAELQLSIGAPSSPHVSNYLMGEFDSRLTDFCGACGAEYTRYADDIAVSTSFPHVLDAVEGEIRRLLGELSYLGLSLNEGKTVNVSKKNRRVLVGLVLANNGVVSIGREEKRRLRATMHRLVQGALPADEVAHFRGQLAFVYSIDPAFVTSLCARYDFPNVGSIGAPSGGDSTD
ncbi:reverse transcriptase [Burkholderia lata]|uniref:RNA-directed DNA polymerase n=1 Tax=Burkholderia lata (strain ATCC 17760 / DSM 23089 / LMG 22485 / NCIMB 9086 / R18194 / 383) TaxID=482957 RepID=A0A6P2ME03_BURL3|nr:retron St85 family RNA-directed DNA polymerase [Burkholderia lata]VWB81602.1 reverse transcriptase [Burkholderia lata]